MQLNNIHTQAAMAEQREQMRIAAANQIRAETAAKIYAELVSARHSTLDICDSGELSDDDVDELRAMSRIAVEAAPFLAEALGIAKVVRKKS